MREFFKNSFPYFRKYMPVIALATFFGLFRTVILLVTPQVVSLLVDRVVNPLLGAEPKHTNSIFLFLIEGVPADDYTRIFWILAATLLVFAALFFVCFYLKWNLTHQFTLKGEGRLRSEALRKVGEASGSLLAQYSSGDLILITTKDARNIRDVYAHRIQFFLDSILYILVASVLLARIYPLLIIAPLVGGGVYITIILFYRKHIRNYYEDVWKDSSTLSTTVQESVYGVRTVASFAQEEQRRAHFDDDNARLLRTNYRGIRLFAVRGLKLQIARTFVFLGSVMLAIFLGLKGKITAGEFTAVMGYLGTFMWQFASLLFSFNKFQDDLVSSRRLFGFLHAKDEVAEKYGLDVPSKTPHIQFSGAGVKNGENYALKGVDLDLPYGKKLGIMGRTGSGKTLLVKLMQGLAETDEGEITLDGRSIHDYDRGELLRTYSYAMQNVFLFSNTIAANVALYDPFAPRERIERAGALAEVDEFAHRFPDGYDTTIGEKGFGLSGGQKQRISIARALFKDASVLIFDDVTSALDLETEKQVFENIEKACGERTLVIVTHRATALEKCDEILFLEDGEITERGSFKELLALGGNFAEIYDRQAREIAAE